ncbi:MAG: CHAT domain-containing protein/Tfp pilus assembly protein PilF [Candidatus Paceibacteria bacterium]
MLAIILIACLTSQSVTPDLDNYLEELRAPGLDRVLELLGPEPSFESLLDPERKAIESLSVEGSPILLAPVDMEVLAETDGWTELINKDRRAKNYLSAANWAAKQAHVRSEMLGDDHTQVARSLSRIGLALHEARRYPDAAKAVRAAIVIDLKHYGRLYKNTRVNLRRLADCTTRIGDSESGALLLQHALDITLDLEGAQAAWVGNLSGNLATALIRTGHIETPEKLFRRAVQIYEELHGSNSTQVAIALNNLADCLTSSDRPSEAIVLIQRALGIYRSLDEMKSFGAIACLHLLGKQSSHEEAIKHYEEAYDLAQDVFGPESPRRATLLNSLGWELVQVRDLPRAETMLNESLRINTRLFGAESHAVSQNLNNIGGLLRAKGQYEEALRVFERCMELQKKFYPPHHPALIVSWNNLATLYFNVGRNEEAEAAWKEGLAMCTKAFPGDHQDAARMLTNLGGLYHYQHRLEEALTTLTAGLEMRRRLFGNHPNMADTASALASTLETMGRLEEAQQLASQALEIHRNLRDTGSLAVAGDLRVLARIALKLEQFERAYEASLESFAIVDAQRTDLLGDATARALFEEAISHGEAAALHISCALAAGRVHEAFGTFELARGRVLLDLVNGNQSSRAEWSATRAADSHSIREQLRGNERIRAYFWSAESLTLFNVDNSAIDAQVLLTGKEAMRELGLDVIEYVQLLSDPNQDGGNRQEELGEQLGALLWPEGESPQARWVILPDGPLHGLPFEALPAARETQCAFVYSSSGTLYQNRCLVAAQQNQSLSLLALGAPEFGSTSGLVPLPATRSEVQTACDLVRKAGGSAKALIGSSATLESLIHEAPNCTLLHLATHGQAGTADSPYAAALSLAEAEGQAAELTLEDLIDKWNGQLANCQLVVLSACDTQRTTLVGNSLMALSWGFFYAGAPSVLASLWKVDDRATALLMARFYENLLGTEPLSKLQALSEAKHWLANANRTDVRAAEKRLGLTGTSSTRRGSAADPMPINPQSLLPYADPAYWAGFILLGAPD